MTITEKILAAHCGEPTVEPGQYVRARVDLAMGNDLSAAGAVGVFKRIGASRVWDPDRIAIVFDHLVPAKDVAAANMLQPVRAFVREQSIGNFYDEGRNGIAHVIVPEQGLCGPGDLVIGGDSHTCTYGALGCVSAGVGHTDLAVVWALGEIWLKVPASVRVVFEGRPGPFVMGKDLILATIGHLTIDGARYQAMEFTGPTIAMLDMSERLTICNMAIEAGAKSGIIAPDQITLAYVDGRARRPWTVYQSDPDASYAGEIAIDVAALRPLVARPFSPDDVATVDDVAGVALDQVFIGSCTNAKLEDLRIAASILRGRKVHPDTRLIVVPASTWVWQQALAEGLLDVFSQAGGAVSAPTCGACFGGHMGILGKGEVCLSTSNRNFVGRMGDPGARSYLSNPAVAAASAITGRITAPEEITRR
jgi:3-isopropylmalate/(R)-2-methylmalate dehydratase large subunit